MRILLRRVGGLSAVEAKVLSALVRCGDPRGMSPTDLAAGHDLPRPTVYNLLGRFREQKLVARTPDPTPEASQRVLYRITEKGRKARERFAKEVGLAC